MWLRLSIGILAGAALGFLYHHFVGCRTGVCPIVRNPYASMVFGAVIGTLFASGLR
ncbi:MAG TPA: YtxH domain-containing protein [bacterium]|nr:YtxH domain-containing protein [bacterium]